MAPSIPTAHRQPDPETLQRARELIQHPLFPSLIRETVERVTALQLKNPVSIPAKRKAPPSRSDEQIAKRRMDSAERMSDLRAAKKAHVQSLRVRSAEDVLTLAHKRYYHA
jgi:hypothetical protein